MESKQIKKVLIATIYRYEPVMLSITKIGPEKLVLLVDENQDETLKNSLKIIKDSLGKVIEIEEILVKTYEVVDTAQKVVKIIDKLPTNLEIYANVSAARKTKALGLLFGSYARSERIKKIIYVKEEDNSIIYLPKLSFHLTPSQKQVLEEIDKSNKEQISIKELAKKINLSTAMVYRIIDELKDMDYLELDEGLKLTDAGKIARL
jgi:CRISPR-associated protein Csa3